MAVDKGIKPWQAIRSIAALPHAIDTTVVITFSRTKRHYQRMGATGASLHDINTYARRETMTLFKTALLASALTATTTGSALAGNTPQQKPSQVGPALVRKLNANAAPRIQALSPTIARKMLSRAKNEADLPTLPAKFASLKDADKLKLSRFTAAFLKELNSDNAPSVQALPADEAHKMLIEAKRHIKADVSEVAISTRPVKVIGKTPINMENR